MFMPRKLFVGKSNRIKLEFGVVEPLPQLKEFRDCERFTTEKEIGINAKRKTPTKKGVFF